MYDNLESWENSESRCFHMPSFILYILPLVFVAVFVFVFVMLSTARCGRPHRAIARVTVISSPQTESLQASKEDPKARDSRLRKENYRSHFATEGTQKNLELSGIWFLIS